MDTWLILINSSQHAHSTNSIPSSVVRRYIRSDAPPPGSCTSTSAETRKRSTRPSKSSSKRHGKGTAASSSSRLRYEKSELVLDLFGEGWLQNPACAGSSIAAMGEDQSDWNSWGSGTIGPSVRYLPRSVPESVDEYDPHLIQGGDTFRQDAYFVNTVAQDGRNRGWSLYGSMYCLQVIHLEELL